MRQHNEIVTAPRTGAQHPHKDNLTAQFTHKRLRNYMLGG